MRIAQIAPLFESVPPKLYGGTERVVHYLTEALLQRGHEVTLFASGDSATNAELVPACARSLRMNAGYEHSLAPHFLMFEAIRKMRNRFDILHFHTDYFHFPFLRSLSMPSVTTLHGRLDFPQFQPLYEEFAEIPLVSISNSQRLPIPGANWRATIYHGIPEGQYDFHPGPGKYAAFLGRMSPEKRPDRAIEIARRAGIPLKMAAKVDWNDKEFFESKVVPMIRENPGVEFIGEIREQEKQEFLGNASVLLFPIDWPEPFGLVMIEAMACGTPVIAFRQGSAPEVITEGVTGFLVDSVEEAVERMRLIPELDRGECYRCCRRKFSMDAVVDAYLSVYAGVIDDYRGANFLSLMHEEWPQWKTYSNTTTRSI